MATSSTLAMASRRSPENKPRDLRSSQTDQLALRRRARVARSQPAWSQDSTLVAGRMHGTLRARTPYIDAGEQEDPHHVDEVPVPGGEFETEMLRRREMPEIGTDQAYDQEGRADDHVGAVEPGRHEESGAVDVSAEIERRVTVLVGLHAGERQSQRDRQDQA